ncbi:MAG: Ig-like domain-containing protein [Elusimicrobiota bacterium]
MNKRISGIRRNSEEEMKNNHLSAFPFILVAAFLAGGASLRAAVISTCQDLKNMDCGQSHQLAADIDGSCLDAPLCRNGYSQVFDGQGHTVSGITIDLSGSNTGGLFATLRTGGKIMNLGVRDVTIRNAQNGAGLVGSLYAGSAVERCFADRVKISGTGSQFGGLVGFTRGRITESYATNVRITKYGQDYDSAAAGGLTGYCTGGCVIERSYAEGFLVGTKEMGGLTGMVWQPGPNIIEDSYAVVDVDGSRYLGGLIGKLYYTPDNPYWTIKNSYAGGSITASQWSIGPVCGNPGSLQGENTHGPSCGSTSCTPGPELKSQSTYAGWDFTNTWAIHEGVSYPYLRWQNLPPCTDADGDGRNAEGSACGHQDNCPGVSNPGQEDQDIDFLGDACDPTPCGQYANMSGGACQCEAYHADTDGSWETGCEDPDSDGDTVGDSVDNCPNTANTGQADTDGSGTGDACNSASDPDADEFESGWTAACKGGQNTGCADNCPDAANPSQADTDGSGIGDACNAAQDPDGDEYEDLYDNCPTVQNPAQNVEVCRPVVVINSITQDGGAYLEVDAEISDPNGDPLSGEVSVFTGGAVTPATMDQESPHLEVENGNYITRQHWDAFGDFGGPLVDNSCSPHSFYGGDSCITSKGGTMTSLHLEFACEPCDTATAFMDYFAPRDTCNVYSWEMSGRDMCLRSKETGDTFDYIILSWGDNGKPIKLVPGPVEAVVLDAANPHLVLEDGNYVVRQHWDPYNYAAGPLVDNSCSSHSFWDGDSCIASKGGTMTSQHFEFACEPCDSATQFMDYFAPKDTCGMDASEIGGRDICIRSKSSGAKFAYVVLGWNNPGENEGAIKLLDPQSGVQTLATLSYSGTLQGSLDLAAAGLVSGGNYSLKITADDGKAAVEGSATEEFLYQGESFLVFGIPNRAPVLAPVLEEWAQRYNGPLDGPDYGYAVTADASGNVYVTGGSPGPTGNWDYATIKYDAGGNQLWAARYDGTAFYADFGLAIEVGASGSVYVTGKSGGAGSGQDYVTIKYDAGGNELWVARYNGPGNRDDEAAAMALDAAESVYVTGSSRESDNLDDYATVKYDTNGNQLWVARYEGTPSGSDQAQALAIDDSGNVYVTGRSRGTDAGDDYATIKYDANGNQLWVARYDGPAGADDYAKGIAVDGSGNVCVTGVSPGNGSNRDYATVKYDAGGNQLWAARYNGPGSIPGNSIDEATGIAVDGLGNVYVTGDSYSTGANYDYTTLKYDPDGNELWMARYNGPADFSDYAAAIAVDDSGSVYVTGHSWGGGTADDCVTVKYDPGGNEAWVARYNGAASGYDWGRAVFVDGPGNVYVTGQSAGTGTQDDYATVKYFQQADAATDKGVPVTITLRGFDPDGDALTFQIMSYPAGGSLSGVTQLTPASAQVTYTPNSGFSGQDSFSFKVNDGELDSNVLAMPVTVNEGNTAPVAVADSYATDEDTTLAPVGSVGPDSTIQSVAGNGSQGYSGDGGPATGAALRFPNDVAIDADGNVYIADANNHRVRKVDAGGTITTYAGTGSAGYSGDGGPATSARLASPVALALDAAGDLYIAEVGNKRIRKVVAQTGFITTVAGNGATGFSGDGEPAASASFNGPSGLAFDAAGNLYIGDLNNHRVRRVTPAGIIDTFAGSGPDGIGAGGFGGDGGPATAARLNQPLGVAFDAAGNLYIADATNRRIRRVDPGGTIMTVAGDGTTGFSGDGGPATDASLNIPSHVAVDGAGNVFIADMANNRIRVLAPDGTISTVVGDGTTAFSGDGGPAGSASLSNPHGIAFDAAGDLYIADYSHQRIRKVDAPLGTVLANDTDADGDSLTAALVDDVSHGSLTLNADGSFAYTPAQDYSGTDSFTYKANDGAADSDPATVTLTVNPVNNPPVADDQDVVTNEDTPVAITFGATDPDSDPLTFEIASGPSHGALSEIDGDQVTYTPGGDYSGSDSFTFKANDGELDSEPATVALTVEAINDPPVLAELPDLTLDEDTAIHPGLNDLLDFASDADSSADGLEFRIVNMQDVIDALGLSDGSTGGEADIPAVTIGEDPDSGEFALRGDGQAHGNTFHVHPRRELSGSVTVTVEARDDGGAVSEPRSFTLTINPVNDPPVADDRSVVTNEDTPASITLTASDEDSAALGYTLLTQPTKGTLTGTPPDLTYTPGDNENGSDSFTFKANDGTTDSNEATVSISITPVNDLPMAADDAYETDEDAALTVSEPSAGLLADDTDAEGDSLTASLAVDVSHGTLELNADGTFTYTPARDYNGEDSFTYKANDGQDDSEPATVTLTINAIEDAPVAADGSVTTEEDTESGPIALDAEDADGDPISFELKGCPAHGTLRDSAGAAVGCVGSGMVALYSFDEGSGATSADGSGNGNDGAVSGSPGWTSGMAGGALEFSGDDQITVPHSASLGMTEALSVETWVRPTGYSSCYDTLRVVYKFSTDGRWDGWNLDIKCGTGLLRVELVDTVGKRYLYYSDRPVPENVFSHVAFTWDGDAVKFYIDGEPAGETPTTFGPIPAHTGPMIIGKIPWTAYRGVIDELAVYDRALGPEEVAARFNAPGAGFATTVTPPLTYTPGADYNGPDSFSFVGNDGKADSNEATVAITVNAVNDPPVAADASVTTDEDAPAAITLSASDVESPSLDYTVLTQPEHGTLSGTAPDLTYTPDADYNGSDSFTFKANDGEADSNEATVSISVTPVNDAPAARDGSIATDEDTESGPIALEADDVDGDALSFYMGSCPAHGTLKDAGGAAVDCAGSAMPAGLVALYSFDEGSGMTAADGSGNGNDGSISGSPVWAGGVAGGALQFSGDDQITVPHSESLGMTEAVSVETWVRPDTYSCGDTYRIIYKFSTDGRWDGWNLDLKCSSGLLRVELVDMAGKRYLYYSDRPVPVNVFSHVAFTWDGGSVKFYIDGEPAGETATAFSSIPAHTGPMIIGKIPWTAYRGVVDELGVYDRALSPEEVAARYDNPGAGFAPPLDPPLSYMPEADFGGSDFFTFTARDGSAESTAGTWQITVTPVNDPPVAYGQQLTTDEDAPAAITLSASDPEQDVISYFIVPGPAHGTLSGTAPDLTYTPDLNYNGQDSFGFKAADTPAALPEGLAHYWNFDDGTARDLAGSNHGTLHGAAPAASGRVGGAMSFDGSSHIDVGTIGDGPSLTISAWIKSDGTGQDQEIMAQGSWGSGTWQTWLVPWGSAGTAFGVGGPGTYGGPDLTDGQWHQVVGVYDDSDSSQTLYVDGQHVITTVRGYTASPRQTYIGSRPGYSKNFNGLIDEVAVYARALSPEDIQQAYQDGSQNIGLLYDLSTSVASIEVTILPVNDAPVAQSQAVQTDEDVSVAIVLAAEDPDGDPFDYALGDPPSHGTLSGDLPELTYTPAPDYNGSDSFTFTASDDSLGSEPATVSVSVASVNDLPVAEGQQVTTDEDTPVAFTLGASDADGDPLEFTVTEPGHGTLSGTAPDLTYTPDLDYNGPDSFEFQADDGRPPHGMVHYWNFDDGTARDLAGSNHGTLYGAAPSASGRVGGAMSFDGGSHIDVGTIGDGPSLTISAWIKSDGTGQDQQIIAQGSWGSATWQINLVPWGSGATAFGVGGSGLYGGPDLTDGQWHQVVGVYDDPSSRQTLYVDGQQIATEVRGYASGPRGTYIGSRPGATKYFNGLIDEVVIYARAMSAEEVQGAYQNGSNGVGPYPSPNPATVTLTIEPVNDPPVADDLQVTTDEDTDALIALTGSDVEGAGLSFSIASLPGEGKLFQSTAQGQRGAEITAAGPVTDSGGRVIYAPPQDANGGSFEPGSEPFTEFAYTANDGGADSAGATAGIVVNPVNDPPVAYGRQLTTDEDIPVAVTLSASDAEQDAISYFVSPGPAHGTLSGTAPELTYTPDLNYNGQDSFGFMAADRPGVLPEGLVHYWPFDDGTARDLAGSKHGTINGAAPVPVGRVGGAMSFDGNSHIDVGMIGDGPSLTISAWFKTTGTAYSQEIIAQGPWNSQTWQVLLKGRRGAIEFGSGGATQAGPILSDGQWHHIAGVYDDSSSAQKLYVDGQYLNAINRSFTAGPKQTYIGSRPGTTMNWTGLIDEVAVYSRALSAPEIQQAYQDGSQGIGLPLDGNTSVATIDLTILPVNDAPVARSQTVQTDEDVPVSIVLSAEDPEGDSIDYALGQPPIHGTLSGDMPELTYTPAPDYNGSDSFTFTASDGSLGSEPATVSVSIAPVNDLPVPDDQQVTTDEDTPVAITLSASDVDGDPIEFAVVSEPGHGTLSGTAPDLTYTPDPDYNGQDSFGFEAMDRAGVPPEGMVHYWSFDDGTARDLAGANDGTMNGAVSTPSGRVGGAMSFDGNSYIDVGMIGDGPSSTISAWFRTTGTAYSQEIIAQGPWNSQTWQVLLKGRQGAIEFGSGGATQAGPSLSDGEWHHIAGVYDAGDSGQKLYVDGQHLRTITRSFSASPRQTYIGSRPSTTMNWTGLIDEVAVYARALSAAEIQQVYQDGLNGVGPLAAANWNQATIALTVDPVNDAPVADDLRVATDEDTDARITLTGSDVEGSGLSFSIASLPGGGKLYQSTAHGERGAEITAAGTQVTDSGGRVIYAPPQDANGGSFAPGSDPFTEFVYTANDGAADSAGATVGIVVVPVNDPPTQPGKPTVVKAVTNEASHEVSWLSSTDIDSNTIYYRVYMSHNGGNFLLVTAPTLMTKYVNGNLLEGTYEYQVEAVDDAGGASPRAASDPAIVDRTPPIVSVGAPPDGMKTASPDVAARVDYFDPGGDLANLISRWSGEGDYRDSAGANDGTPGGSVSFDAGRAGQGFRLRNSGGVRAVGEYPVAQANEITMMGWIKLDTHSGYSGLVSSEGCCQYRILVSPDHRLFYNAGTHIDIPVGPALALGEWHHAAMTIRGGQTAKIYLNGELIHESEQGVPAQLPPLTTVLLGVGENIGTHGIEDGMVDEVEVYSRALTDEEVRVRYEDHPLGVVASGMDTATLAVTRNGQDVTGEFTAGGAAASAQFLGLPDGEYALSASVSDLATNQGASAPVKFTVDTTPPTITLTAPLAGQQFIATQNTIPIGFSVADNLDPSPQVVRAQLMLEEARSGAPGKEQGPVDVTSGQAPIEPLSLQAGLWKLSVTAADWVGNQRTEVTPDPYFEVIHDIKPPRTTVTIAEPRYPPEPAPGDPEPELVYLTGATFVIASSTDDLVTVGDNAGLGVATQTIKVGGNVRFEYRNPSPAVGESFVKSFQLGDVDGPLTLLAEAEDVLGKMETGQALSLHMDNLAPVMGHTFSAEPVVRAPKNEKWFAAAFQIIWEANDGTGSGVAHLDGPTDVTDDAFDAPYTGRSADNVDNERTLTVRVNLDTIAPVVDAGGDVTVEEGVEVEFSGTVTDNLDEVAQYGWTFGDGGIADQEPKPTHTYLDEGIYEVTLTATDHAGHTTSDSLTVTVLNAAPVVTSAAAEPQPVGEGSALTITAAFTDLGILDTHAAEIDWGDNTTSAASLTDEGGSGSLTAEHVYADDGIYTVRVTVSDDDGDSGEATLDVTVDNAAPTIEAGADQAVDEGGVISLAPSTFHDQGTLDTHTETINWGDTTPTEAGVVSESPFGPPGDTAGANGTISGIHVYADNDTYTVTVCVKDDDNAEQCDALTATVNNVAPTMEAGTDKIAAADGRLIVGGGIPVRNMDVWRLGQSGLQSVVIGPEEPVTAPPIMFHDQGTLDTHGVLIEWGDDTSDAAVVTESPSGPPGLTAGADGIARAQHQYTANGIYPLKATVTDDDGGSVFGGYSVTVDVVPPATMISHSGNVSADSGIPAQATVFLDADAMNALSAEDPVDNEIAFGVQWTFRRDLSFEGSDSTYTVHEEAFSLAEEGVHILEYFSVDKRGNEETHKLITIGVDHTPPIPALEVGDPKYLAFGLTFIEPETPITLSAEDPVTSDVASGVDRITYRIDGGELQTYTEPFPLEPGTHIIDYGAVDKVENERRETFAVAVANYEFHLTGVYQVDGTGTSDIKGLVQSNGLVDLGGSNRVDGDVTAMSVVLKGKAEVTGAITEGETPVLAEPIDIDVLEPLALAVSATSTIPEEFMSEGGILINGGQTLVLDAGTYVVDRLHVNSGSSLETNGTVNILVRGEVRISGGGMLNVTGEATDLVVFTSTSQPIHFSGGALALGVFYGPHGRLEIAGNSRVGGHLFGKTAKFTGTSNTVEIGDSLPDDLADEEPGAVDEKGKGKVAAAPAGADPTFTLRDLYVFPNPAVGGAVPTIHVAVGIADKVTLRIYNIAGQQVHQATMESTPPVLDDGSGPKYAYEYAWEGHIPSGVYLYTMVAEKSGEGSIRKAGKFAVVR